MTGEHYFPISVNGVEAGDNGNINISTGTGTVTSVATGYGLSGGTITTSGTLSVDTATLSNTYVRISDTSNMLSPYLESIDTSAMLSKYVPYIGATSSVDLGGVNQLNAGGVLIRNAPYNYINLSSGNNKGIITLFNNNAPTGNINLSVNNTSGGNKYINFPDSNGTVALKEYVIDSLKRSSDSVYARKNGQWYFQYKDSSGGGSGSGTVTSVATGYGLLGGTITTTGTLIVDTATLANKYVRLGETQNGRFGNDTATVVMAKIHNN